MSRVPVRHKVFGILGTVGWTHHTFELVREHVFLAVHEYVSHHGWLLYSLGGAVATACGIGWVVSRKRGSEPETENE